MKIPTITGVGNCLMFSLLTWAMNDDCRIVRRFNYKRGSYTYLAVFGETCFVFKDNNEVESKLFFKGTPTQVPFNPKEDDYLFMPCSNTDDKMPLAMNTYAMMAMEHALSQK